MFSWASWKSAGRTSRRPQGHTTVSSQAKRILGTIAMGSSSPLSRAASYRITFALSISPFFWAHNTDINSAIGILKDEELIRPSKWQQHPSPNDEYTNWYDVWIPPMGFYCRGSLISNEAAVKSAAQFAGVHSPRPLCIGGKARLRQDHCMIPRGGTYADIAASHYYDCIHAKDGRWKLRSSIAVPSYVGMLWWLFPARPCDSPAGEALTRRFPCNSNMRFVAVDFSWYSS